jgi:phenylalanyl-tRNA synthetase beta chain
MLGERGGPDAEIPAELLVGVEEETRVAGVFAGTVRPAEWNVPTRVAGFFEAKGVVERLASGARFEPRTRPFLHPGRAAAVIVDGVEAGWVGELHPETAEKFELEGWPVAAFEVDLTCANPDPEMRFRPFVNVPAVVMDLAVIVDGDVAVGAMLDEVAALGSPFLVEARVFDVYEGSQVPEGKKSVALGFTFQAEETLTDEAVKGELDRISERLRGSCGTEVRGN